jgi:hypothetical protein
VFFYAEMHQNNIFFIFKKLFLRLEHQNDSKHIEKKIRKKKPILPNSTNKNKTHLRQDLEKAYQTHTPQKNACCCH